MKLSYFKENLHKNIVLLLWGAALICFLTSFLHISSNSVTNQSKRVEKRVHQREKILEKYVEKAFDTPEDQWLNISDLPEDMVIYRFVDDTLQSWANLFPITNDDINPIPHWYRIHDLNNTNIFNTP